MDTLAFWLPLFLLFLSALVGAVIKRRSCDHCLKKFEHCKILLKTNQGDWISGTLEVFAQGIELKMFGESQLSPEAVYSHIIHSAELDKIPYLVRKAPPPDTQQGFKWKKERERLLNPPLIDRVFRSFLNSFNMLRDSFGQAMNAIIGSLSKDTRIGKTKGADKRLNEMQGNITGMIPNSWEPILEKYLGKYVCVERRSGSGLVLESGILEDYSNKYLLLRDVKFSESDLSTHVFEWGGGNMDAHDVLYSRSESLLRYSLKDN